MQICNFVMSQRELKAELLTRRLRSRLFRRREELLLVWTLTFVTSTFQEHTEGKRKKCNWSPSFFTRSDIYSFVDKMTHLTTQRTSGFCV